VNRPTTRTARIAAWSAAPLALVASAALVATASHSAFTSQTSNPTSNWASGTVNLTDDDSDTALFNVTNMKPGATGSKCIAVTSTGTLPSTVKLFGTNPATTNGLANNVSLTVTQGTGGSFGSCTGFAALGTGAQVYSGTLANFGTTATGFATGLGTWAPTGAATETRVFKVEYTFSSAAPNSTQGGTASIGLTWEAQNS
jgi:hypothetical protein